MFHCHLLWIFALFIVCSFRGKDFQSLGRHHWRCKKRLNSTSGPNQTINITLESESSVANVTNVVKCSCGKECKGVKGLKMHQRTCRVIEHMEEEDQPPEFENSNIGSREHFNNDLYVLSFDLSSTVNIKAGIKLTRSPEQRTMANDCFKTIFLNLDLKPENIDSSIRFMNDTIYNYFKDSYSNSTNHSNPLFTKYKGLFPKSLKTELKQLKNTNAPLNEIKFASHLLLTKLRNQHDTSSNSCTDNPDHYIAKQFMVFC